MPVEMEVVHAEFAVALLGNDEFGSGLAAVFAMNKRNCVGIAFDLSAVGQVAKPGPASAFFFVLFALTVELRERQEGRAGFRRPAI